MLFDAQHVRQCLQEFDFQTLFIEVLGWNRHSARPLEITINGQAYSLISIAEQGGLVVFQCSTDINGSIPDYTTRRKIERQVAKYAYEHLIIYRDGEQTTQLWQWVKRAPDKPDACHEHSYHHSQPGDSLIQKLNVIAFTLDDLDQNDQVLITNVTQRIRAAFDVDRLTRRFYDRFKKEHDVFLNFLNGIPDEELQRWYVSVMLNRLMFIYFIQKKGFLDGNNNYLRAKLGESKAQGKGLFYHEFLCPLFFEGFAKTETERSAKTNNLLGRVPYLNGGLFLKHEIEKRCPDIQIPDAAFERIFDFFDQYQWHLDERPLRADNEINPDVLGYIFEKYINQKQMGAYYTKEDITGYISKNTIIPFLFDTVQKKYPAAFQEEHTIWRLLQDDPDRYIYPAVRKGVDLPLPINIAVGLNDVSKRTNWNKTALPEYALPTEIWREVVARRKRYEEIKTLIAEGKITSINDFITYNLNVRQFAQDVIENIEDPNLLRAFYHAIAGKIPGKSNEKLSPGISILDPTCGSGAFLFAALNILEPLYEACLDRMQSFVNDLERSGEKHNPKKFEDFRNVLDQVKLHPNRRYFILKSIIINNLYGVDIMEEATEICKLRLFLKLVAQVERMEDIEPLPDIDFNIRAGNTLVGFATYEEVKKAVNRESTGQLKIQFGDPMERIEEKAQDVDRLFSLFRQMQTKQGMEAGDFVEAKQELRNRLKELEDELDRYLAGEYGIDQNNIPKAREYDERFKNWRQSHKPFHWFVEFYGILKNSGFDVIIGNPPYVEYSKVRKIYTVKNYKTESSNNLYAFCSERAFKLKGLNGRFGMILPNSSISASKMSPLQKIFCNKRDTTWISNFAWRPSKLFDGADMLLAIIITARDEDYSLTFASRYHKWYSQYRDYLFQNIAYQNVSTWIRPGTIPKPPDLFSIILQKLTNKSKRILSDHFSQTIKPHTIFYFRAVQYWIKILDNPPLFEEDGISVVTSEMKSIYCSSDELRYILVSILSSSLFFVYYITYASCQVINNRDFDLSFDIRNLLPQHRKLLVDLSCHLQQDYQNNSKIIERNYSKRGRKFTMRKQHFYVKESKPIIDEIDRVLAKHYGFTDEELDFIINYDIKYRMGLGAGEKEEE